MSEILNDELKIYRGKDFIVNDKIIIHQPSLDEICEYGEREYWSMIYTLTSVGADLKFQLWDIGIDYTTINDFELFYNILCNELTKEKTSIILGDLNFKNFKLYTKKNNEIEEIFMYDEKNDIFINDYTYSIIVDILRKIHGLKRNSKLPANEATKMILIDDARDEYNINKNKEYHSQLLNMVSAMTNSEGFKYNHDDVWNMKINAFIDSVKRILKIKDADSLLQSGRSGYGINLKDIDKKQLDWLGELE